MTNLFTKFKTEDNFEVDGVWKEYYGSAKVKIARAGNKNTEYYKYVQKAAKKYKNAGTDTKADQDRPWAEVFAKTVIRGWKVQDGEAWVDGIHLPDERGNIVIKPYTQENVIETLLALPDFFRELRDDAEEMRTFQKDSEEDDLKN